MNSFIYLFIFVLKIFHPYRENDPDPSVPARSGMEQNRYGICIHVHCNEQMDMLCCHFYLALKIPPETSNRAFYSTESTSHCNSALEMVSIFRFDVAGEGCSLPSKSETTICNTSQHSTAQLLCRYCNSIISFTLNPSFQLFSLTIYRSFLFSIITFFILASLQLPTPHLTTPHGTTPHHTTHPTQARSDALNLEEWQRCLWLREWRQR
jgi:hypothetical protein